MSRKNTMKGVTLSKEEEEPEEYRPVAGLIAATATTAEALSKESDATASVPVSASVLRVILEKIDMLTAGLLALQTQPPPTQPQTTQPQTIQSQPTQTQPTQTQPTQTTAATSTDVTNDHPITTPTSAITNTPIMTATPMLPPTWPTQPSTHKFLNKFLPGKISTKFVETSVDQLEAWLTINDITNDEEKFAILKLSMEPETYRQVAAVIQNPPLTNKFTALKNHIIKTFTQSEASRIKSLLHTIELGNRRPSQLLAEMSALYNGPKDRIFVELFVSRLPSTVRGILMGMQSPHAGAETPVDTLAQWADAITDQLDKGERLSAIHSPPGPPRLDEIMVGLTDSINAFNENARSRARQNNKPTGPRKPQQQKQHAYTPRPTKGPDNWDDEPPAPQPERRRDDSIARHPMCWYHRTFGHDAISCRTPCNHSSQLKN